MFWSGLILGLLIGGAIGAVVMGIVASGRESVGARRGVRRG
jgi:gas vesicle protein